MRIVITGATGNVGTSLVDRLVADDEVTEIVGIARRGPEHQVSKTRWVSADVVTHDLGALFRGADAVVHLAWVFQPTHDPVSTWKNNVLGSSRVFEAVAAADVPVLVHASSVGAYSPGPGEDPVDESWPTDSWPAAAYGREKAYVERLLDVFELRHPDVRTVRLRPGFIFKRSAASQQRRLFAGPFLPNALLDRRAVPIVPDLPGMRLQALHSADAASAYHLALARDVRGAFNVAAEGFIDPETLAEIFEARIVRIPRGAARVALDVLWRLRLVPASPHLLDLALRLPVMDTTRARTELGWTPARTAKDALGEAVSGMRATAGGGTPPLAPHAGGPARLEEVWTGVGGSGGVSGDGR